MEDDLDCIFKEIDVFLVASLWLEFYLWQFKVVRCSNSSTINLITDNLSFINTSIQFNDFVQKDSGIIIHTNNETSAEVHAVLTVPSEHSSRELFVALTNNVSSTTNFEANSTQNVQRFNDSYVVNSSFFWRIEYSVIAAVSGAIALILLVGIFLCWRRHSRVVHPPQRSVYSVQDGTWDSLSLHYMDNPAEFAKNEAWDEMSDDSYVASLDQAMSRKMAPVTYYRNNAVLMNGPSAFRYSTSSTVPIVSTSPTQDPQQF